jgi:hypothetical protein
MEENFGCHKGVAIGGPARWNSIRQPDLAV